MHTIYLNKYKFLIIFHIFQMTKFNIQVSENTFSGKTQSYYKCINFKC